MQQLLRRESELGMGKLRRVPLRTAGLSLVIAVVVVVTSGCSARVSGAVAVGRTDSGFVLGVVPCAFDLENARLEVDQDANYEDPELISRLTFDEPMGNPRELAVSDYREDWDGNWDVKLESGPLYLVRGVGEEGVTERTYFTSADFDSLEPGQWLYPHDYKVEGQRNRIATSLSEVEDAMC